jgi:hypothetical protein
MMWIINTIPRALLNTITSLIGPMTNLFPKDGEIYEANFMKYFTVCLVIFVKEDQNLPKLLHCHSGCYGVDLIYFYAAITAVTGALILSIIIAAWIYCCLRTVYQEISQTDCELRPMRR